MKTYGKEINILDSQAILRFEIETDIELTYGQRKKFRDIFDKATRDFLFEEVFTKSDPVTDANKVTITDENSGLNINISGDVSKQTRDEIKKMIEEISSSFRRGLTGIDVVDELPTNGNFEGRQVYLTTEDKIYTFTGDWIAK